MNFSDFRKSIESPEPAYLLVTDQDYLKRKVYEYCQKQVEEEVRVFNWTVLDLEKDSAAELINVAKTLPWMGPLRWIYVRNADSAKDLLGEYLSNPSPSTVLILELKRRPPKWSKLPTIELSSRTDPVRWVMSKAKKEGFQMDRPAAETLVELVGENYQQFEAELEKQFLWNWETRQISVDSVLRMTLHVREHDVFNLINAIARRDAANALRVLQRLLTSGMTVPQIGSMLYWSFRRVLVASEMLDQGLSFQSMLSELKLWSYKGKEKEIREYPYEVLVQILNRLRETDRLAKTTGAEAGDYLVRVVVDTCSLKSI